jgi:hypothetical protein
MPAPAPSLVRCFVRHLGVFVAADIIPLCNPHVCRTAASGEAQPSPSPAAAITLPSYASSPSYAFAGNAMASSTSAGCASTRKAAAASRESKSRAPATAPATAVTSPKTTASRRYVRIHTTIVLLLAGGVAIGMLIV